MVRVLIIIAHNDKIVISDAGSVVDGFMDSTTVIKKKDILSDSASFVMYTSIHHHNN